MSEPEIFAIGDVQGCFDPLQQLITRIDQHDKEARLWFAGDLVNRGPASLEVLRWVRSQRARARTVLGNHDLHLLAFAAGARRRKRRDTLDPILAADDGAALIDWLRHQPLLVRHDPYVLVHAGLHPAWSISLAEELARGIEEHLASEQWRAWLRRLYQTPSVPWHPELTGMVRARAACDVLVRVRTVTAEGALDDTFTGPPAAAPEGRWPWFERGQWTGHTILFGHWAALGARPVQGGFALDSGCVWGRRLSALRLATHEILSVPGIPLPATEQPPPTAK